MQKSYVLFFVLLTILINTSIKTKPLMKVDIGDDPTAILREFITFVEHYRKKIATLDKITHQLLEVNNVDNNNYICLRQFDITGSGSEVLKTRIKEYELLEREEDPELERRND